MRYVHGVGFDAFVAHEMMQDAVARRLEIIGEAARRISPECVAEHPEIPWREIVGMRNVLAHEYGEVLLEVVWDVLEVVVPDLIAALEPLASG